jgi:hypothetical protein
MPETPKKSKDQKSKSRTKKKLAKFTPKTARTVTFALSSHLDYEPPSDSEDWDSGSDTDNSDDNPKRKAKRGKRKARSLNRVDHSETKGWKHLVSSHTTEVYKTFEQWVGLFFRRLFSINSCAKSYSLVETSLFGLPNRLAPAPTGLFGLGLGFGCRSRPKPGRSACKPVCRLGKPVCSLSRETGLWLFLVPFRLVS